MLSINIVNDSSGTEENSNYYFEVSVNYKVIYKGTIKGHNRKNNWIELLKLLIEQNNFSENNNDR